MKRVFVASSTEGVEIAKTAIDLLEDEIGATAELVPWTRAFELSETTVEALEREAQQCDFAVIVVTPDDLTTSRSKQKRSPRDNVVFELGLFMGGLGRERCYVLQQESPGLKTPTDLLGLTVAMFHQTEGKTLEGALAKSCRAIAKRIAAMSARPRFSPEELAERESTRQFCVAIAGAWWERIINKDVNALSFMRLEYDAAMNSVRVRGDSYGREGNLVATWKSLIARVDKDERTLVYHWEGSYTLAELAHLPFHGFARMAFDRPAAGTEIAGAKGKFWEVDESNPKETKVKPCTIRRIADASAVAIMARGTEKAVRVLIKKTLASW